MCLIFVANCVNKRYPFVVIANRDEFHDRGAAPAQFWESCPELLAGRDLAAGGTWLGMTRRGRFAAITNYRDPGRHRVDAPSRGALVRNFLSTRASAGAYMRGIAQDGESYNGFSLLLHDGESLSYFSNRSESAQTLGAGIFALSNHLLDTPWPKVLTGKKRFAALLEVDPPRSEQLFELMADTSIARSDALPATGVTRERESALSSIFVRGEDYGTRCTTVIMRQASGNVDFIERSFDKQGKRGETVAHAFAIES